VNFWGDNGAAEGCPTLFGGTCFSEVITILFSIGYSAKEVPPRGWRNLPFEVGLAEPQAADLHANEDFVDEMEIKIWAWKRFI